LTSAFFSFYKYDDEVDYDHTLSLSSSAAIQNHHQFDIVWVAPSNIAQAKDLSD